MKLKSGFLILTTLLMLAGCKNKITIEGFDVEKWKTDKGGCEGLRQEIKLDFLKIKNQLKGHSSTEIIEYLGRPDKEDLRSRNQKFFYYYLEPGKHCDEPRGVSKAEKITIRFSAMNLATEINYSFVE